MGNKRDYLFSTPLLNPVFAVKYDRLVIEYSRHRIERWSEKRSGNIALLDEQDEIRSNADEPDYDNDSEDEDDDDMTEDDMHASMWQPGE